MGFCCLSSAMLLTSSFDPTICKPLFTSSSNRRGRCGASPSIRKRKKPGFMVVSSFPYQKFVQFALDESNRHTHLSPLHLEDKFSAISAKDEKIEIQMLSFKAPKIRLFRSLYVDGPSMQVLDLTVFPEPKFDLPIFCANFFTSASTNIVVLDLNPLYDVISRRDYRDKYYKSLVPLGRRHAELLPWGGKLTSESLKFFSPIVIWTKFTSSEHKHAHLFSAFKDYYKVWLELMDQASEEMDASQVICNIEAQHKYVTWRAEKDPGYRVLDKLVGETRAKDLVRSFLFHGVDELGTKTFLDYFPEYRCDDGTVNVKRSIIGKSFEYRPWDERGEFIGDSFL